MAHNYVLLRMLRQVSHKFRACLGWTVSSSPGWIIYQVNETKIKEARYRVCALGEKKKKKIIIYLKNNCLEIVI